MTDLRFHSLIGLTLFIASVVSADVGGGRSFEDGLFWGADLNRDERLDPEEARRVKNLGEKDVFDRYDEDKSGYITRMEFMEFLQNSPWVNKFKGAE